MAAEAQRELRDYLTEHRHGSRIASKARFGVTVRRTGVVSVEERVRSKGKRGKRPKFSELQLDEALLPAVAHNLSGIERDMVHVVERLQRKWVTG